MTYSASQEVQKMKQVCYVAARLPGTVVCNTYKMWKIQLDAELFAVAFPLAQEGLLAYFLCILTHCCEYRELRIPKRVQFFFGLFKLPQGLLKCWLGTVHLARAPNVFQLLTVMTARFSCNNFRLQISLSIL